MTRTAVSMTSSAASRGTAMWMWEKKADLRRTPNNSGLLMSEGIVQENPIRGARSLTFAD